MILLNFIKSFILNSSNINSDINLFKSILFIFLINPSNFLKLKILKKLDKPLNKYYTILILKEYNLLILNNYKPIR